MKRSFIAALAAVALLAVGTPNARAGLSTAAIKLTKLNVTSLSKPVAMALRPGDANTLYVVEQTGTIRPVDRTTGVVGAPVLDVSGEVLSGNEQGLLGLAFNGAGDKLYVYLTAKNGATLGGDDILREYAFNGTADANSARNVLRIRDPYKNHNGGTIAFGPDGYLYVGTGDSGGAGDPDNRSQNIRSLFGKMLRLDPTPSGNSQFTVPPTNPYVGRKGNDLIWARGLRNPWKWSFDRSTDDLWIGDVGQKRYEEIDFQSSGASGGANYGWHRMEGRHRYNGYTPPRHHRSPVYEYAHVKGNCAITGGYVYRGSAIPDLAGAYVFADLCVGVVRAFVRDPVEHRSLGVGTDFPTSFGQDASGELYVMDLGGDLFRIDPA